MSSTQGKTLTCDLCGSSVFLKFTGVGETDGGYTRWREYEKAEGWKSLHFGSISYGDVCPECAARIQDALTRCIKEIRG